MPKYSTLTILLILYTAFFSACAPAPVEHSVAGKAIPDPTGTPGAPAPENTAPAFLSADMGVPVKIITGQVTVTLSKSEYPKGEKIVVTVANGLSSTIYADDMKSACSIVILEQQSGSAWTSLLDCGMERLPMTVAIGPGLGRVVELDPRSQLVDEGSASGFEPGSYRIRYTYRFDAAQEGDEPSAVISDSFTILP